MKIGILGAGFGLYGYLPAIASGCSDEAVVPERYRRFILGRADIASLADRIQWCNDETTLLDIADAVVVARRPSDQVDLVGLCLRRGNINRILLEKPLAPTPERAMSLIQSISTCDRIFRIGYIFRYTGWAKRLLLTREKNLPRERIELAWHFQAHHFKTGNATWKRQVSAGGGVIRFFGIQLIALLAELGYSEVAESEVSSKLPDELDQWRATFTDPALASFRIEVLTDTPAERFSLRYGSTSVQLADPFSESVPGAFDRRVERLTELFQELRCGDPKFPNWYMRSIRLWSDVEKVTKRVPRWS